MSGYLQHVYSAREFPNGIAMRRVKDYLILLHRKHEGFAFNKVGVLHCEECALVGKPTINGYLILADGKKFYAVDVI